MTCENDVTAKLETFDLICENDVTAKLETFDLIRYVGLNRLLILTMIISKLKTDFEA